MCRPSNVTTESEPVSGVTCVFLPPGWRAARTKIAERVHVQCAPRRLIAAPPCARARVPPTHRTARRAAQACRELQKAERGRGRQAW